MKQDGPFDALTSSLRLAVSLLRTFDLKVACHQALRCANAKPAACRRLTQGIRFDLMACHEGDFRLLKAGGSRIEWYRYGDSNPGVQTENLAS